jgi:hypothetical protein
VAVVTAAVAKRGCKGAVHLGQLSHRYDTCFFKLTGSGHGGDCASRRDRLALRPRGCPYKGRTERSLGARARQVRSVEHVVRLQEELLKSAQQLWHAGQLPTSVAAISLIRRAAAASDKPKADVSSAVVMDSASFSGPCSSKKRNVIEWPE